MRNRHKLECCGNCNSYGTKERGTQNTIINGTNNKKAYSILQVWCSHHDLGISGTFPNHWCEHWNKGQWIEYNIIQ